MAAAKKRTQVNELTQGELDSIRGEVSKLIGVDLLWGDDEDLRLKKLPLGLPALDAALNGGVAFDRITLLVGEYSAGKTLVALQVIGAALRDGLTAAFIDVERTWTSEWAETLGIDPSKVLVVRPRTAEKAFDAALALVKRGVHVLVIDSLAAMRVEAELASGEDELFEKKFIGQTAMLIGRGLSTLLAENRGTAIICINQLREKPGVVYGNPETMPGGRAPGFYAWQLLRVRRGSYIEENGRRVGYKLRVVVQKNKQGAPFTEAEIPFMFTGEFDEISGLVDLALDLGVVVQDGGYYNVEWPDADGEVQSCRLHGRKRVADFVRENQQLKEFISARLNALPEVDL